MSKKKKKKISREERQKQITEQQRIDNIFHDRRARKRQYINQEYNRLKEQGLIADTNTDNNTDEKKEYTRSLIEETDKHGKPVRHSLKASSTIHNKDGLYIVPKIRQSKKKCIHYYVNEYMDYCKLLDCICTDAVNCDNYQGK